MRTPSDVEIAQYGAVNARRLQEDNLLWQVPVLSLTAQAFLISISLAAGSSAYARIVSSALSLVVTGLSISLMARHRQAEITDARWMEQFERECMDVPFSGAVWRAQRESHDPTTPTTRWVPHRRAAFPIWIWGLTSFGAVDVLTIVVTLIAPRLLAGS